MKNYTSLNAPELETGGSKKVLTFDEVANYIGVSKNYLYKLTSTRKIPYYKPNGKLIYFDAVELDGWLHRNRVATAAELDARAMDICRKGGVL
ncbi:MAG: helix-turn-helix domain-containing protein [Prevotella sp.]|nr:helix-turn-helix domain-containing protein [Prevotella sp.]